MSDTPSWWLTPLGYQPWTTVIDELQGLRCAWADYTGFHHDEPPDALVEAPPFSHVWGWSPDRLVRIRVDIDQGVVAILTTTDKGGAGTELVDVVERIALPFDETQQPSRLIQVLGQSPLVFVAGPAASNA